jgi:TonB family protein
MRLFRPAFAVLLLALPVFATDPYEQVLSTALTHHVLILRNFYTDSHLKFDSNGTLTSKGTPGFGPIEGRVYIREVELKPYHLTIHGSRPVGVFDQATESVHLADIHQAVTIDIDLPTSETPQQSTLRILRQVFLTLAEEQQFECSEEEAKAFVRQAKNAIRNINFTEVPKKDASPPPDADNLVDIGQSCYPGGDRACHIGHGVIAPKPLKTPDPPYPPGSSRAGHTGTVVVMLIVDPKGNPTSVILTRSVGADLDEAAIKAIRGWKFAPATFKGSPVPVSVHVEMNFTLN